MSKPLVSVLLAAYFPNRHYFEKQLKSIDDQTYSTIELIVCDDSENEEQFQSMTEILKNSVKKVPYRIIKNEKNCGSNLSFARLTLESTGDFLAYCDQDDIWVPDKIETLISLLEREHGVLAYSDLSLIDETDQITEKSMLKSNFRLKHVHGEEAFSYLIESNSVTGCSMLINAKVAKLAVPFPDSKLYVHDHWLAICASASGRIVYCPKPLVLYRIHGQNQIGVKRFHNLITIEDYVYAKLEEPLKRLELVEKRLELNSSQRSILENKKRVLNLRLKMSKGESVGSLKEVRNLLRTHFLLSVYELILFKSGRSIQKFLLNIKNHVVRTITGMVNRFRLNR